MTKKETVYTIEGLPYCNNPYSCGEDHPNSTKNILERGKDVKMYTEKELEVRRYEMLDLTDEQREQIERIVTKPMTVRINQVELAYYLLQVREQYGVGSLSEAVRLCVQKMHELFPIGEVLPTAPKPKKEIVLEEKPEPIEDKTEAVPVEIEEDEMTF
jgi:hypothetical protein